MPRRGSTNRLVTVRLPRHATKRDAGQAKAAFIGKNHAIDRDTLFGFEQ
jgi:hypothetical protein